MHYFRNDYTETAHPNILKSLIDTNMVKDEPYGLDNYCVRAKTIIKKLIGDNSADIHFFTGGTQTNLTAISAFLRPHEAVVAADTAHISTHETGAIEATGHKIIEVTAECGKITVRQIAERLKIHKGEHMVKPRLVKISNSTELGTIYEKKELEQISAFCKNNGLLLYLDGARLGAAIAASNENLTLKDICALTDAFYIGATKCGAMLGEALVIKNDSLKHDFRHLMKMRGAMLAKGKVLGVQFIELFKDGLYFKLANHANKMADKLRAVIKNAGYELLVDSNTNQVFFALPNDAVQKLQNDFAFEIWEQYDNDTTAIRLVTSWATEDDDIEAFSEQLDKII